MVGGHVTKALDDGVTIDGDVFDKIEDLLDFSDEELQTLLEPQGWSFDDDLDLRAADWGFPLPAQAPSVGRETASRSTVAIRRNATAFPADDIGLSEFEWLPNFDGEALSPKTIQPPKCDVAVEDGGGKVELHNGTLSPVSVLGDNGLLLGGASNGAAAAAAAGGSLSSSSSSSSSPTSSSCCSSVGGGVKLLAPAAKPPDSTAVRGRAPRTKRARPPSAPRSNVHVPIVCSAMDGTGSDSSPSTTINSTVSEPDPDPLVDVDEKRKKPKTKVVSWDNPEVPGVRKCMHCEIQKTPQWRAGPMGPKTLCNACGVRYKSGRLFPEYRPAASPTFVSSLHSNSHKKVVEMRVRATKTEELPPAASSLPASAKGCELLNYIRSS